MSIGWHDDRSVFRAALDELLELLVAAETLETVLDRVVWLACSGIGACDLASITWTDNGAPQTIVYTDPVAETIDEAQYAHDAGPCLEASRRREVVSVPSMADGETWRAFREAAMSHGVYSSLSLPMAVGDVQVGALNLYGRADHAFNSVAPEAALLFAKQAAAAVWTVRTSNETQNLVKHLETALQTRELIGLATGIVMANEKLTSAEAFDRLRTTSQHRNIKLRDLAVEVTETGATPT